jgi:transcriptional regulator of NAD metabolism
LSANLTDVYMNKEQEEAQKINLPDTLSDFASAIREHGPILVAHDMRKYFPERHSEYVSASLNLERQRQVAVLFKPKGGNV